MAVKQTQLKLLAVICTVSSLLTAFSATAQHQTWETLREQGANFFEIKDSFERQNAELISTFYQNPAMSGGDSVGYFNNIIKFNRWSHFVAPRVTESRGELNAIATGTTRAIIQQSQNTHLRNGELWRAINPPTTPQGGGSGRINAIRFHPTNGNIIFACSPSGGLWRSVNQGTSWRPIGENIAILGCSDVAFAPNDPNVMYLATGDGEAADSYSTGVYKSTDGGLTWQITGLTFTAGQNVVLSRILVNPNNGHILVSGSNGIYRSTNEGVTWTQVSTINTRDMEFKANDPSVVYASTYRPRNGTSIFLRSADGGVTWVANNHVDFLSNCVRGAIAVTPANPNVVYLLVADTISYKFKGLYRSSDGGLTFTKPTSQTENYSNILGWNVSNTNNIEQGWYDLAIAASPINANEVHIGGINIWKTTDGGAQFSIVSHWLGITQQGFTVPILHASIHDILYRDNELWAATDGGIASKGTNNVVWINKNNNLNIAQIHAIGSSSTNSNLIISGHQNNGTNLTTNPTTWQRVLGGDGLQCFISRTNDDTMFTALPAGFIHRSSNRGQTFVGTATVPNATWFTPLVQDPSVSSILYAGGNQVYKSVESGSSWTQISNFTGVSAVSAIDVAKTNAQIIVAAKGIHLNSNQTSTPQIFKTINGGTTWVNITGANFPPNASIIGLHLDVNNPNRIFIGFATYSGNSVFVSADGGTSWTNFSTGLPQVPANCFVTIANNASGEIFVGTDIGVYRRNNNMTSWEYFSTNLPTTVISDLEVFYPTKKLRCSTYGRGIWETALPNTNNIPHAIITNPTEGGMVAQSNVQLKATAIDGNGQIVKVEFYKDSILLSTDLTAPYGFDWVNAPLGKHNIIAKVYDDSATVGISDTITFWVAKNRDLAVTKYIDLNTYQLDTIPIVKVVLQNQGFDTLRNAVIYYQLNNNNIQSKAWSGFLSPLATTTFTFDSIMRLSNGNYTIKTWSSMPNRLADENNQNDTLKLDFNVNTQGICGDWFEPNDDFETAKLTPNNIKIKNTLSDLYEADYYKIVIPKDNPWVTLAIESRNALGQIFAYQNLNFTSIRSFINDSTMIDCANYFQGDSTLTLYIKITASDNLSGFPTCYSFAIRNYGRIYRHVGIDSILVPQGIIHTNTFVPRIRYKNYSNIIVNQVGNTFHLDNTFFSGNIRLPQPLLPNDTITVSIPNTIVPTFATGNHTFRAVPSSVNGFGDDSTARHNLSTTFRYVTLPTISLTAPANQAIYNPSTTVTLTANASASTGGTITRVEFYNGNTLLNTDVTSPYSFSWANVPMGTYTLTAKVFDNQGYNTTSTPIRIYVSSGLDAGVNSITNLAPLVFHDSIIPIVKVLNYGTTALTAFTVNYQIDNQPIISKSFTNINIPSRNYSANLELPLARYSRGVHTFKVWTSQPNNGLDNNASNDTLNMTFNAVGFDYCGNNFEPNNTISSATPIPLNTTVTATLEYNQINGNFDQDFYQFSTTERGQDIEISIWGLTNNSDLYLRDRFNSEFYAANVTRFGDSAAKYLFQLRQRDTGTYMVLISGFQYDCYSFRVKNIYHDIAIDTIFSPNGHVTTPSVSPSIQISNLGTKAIEYFYVSFVRNGENVISRRPTYLDTPLLPNTSIRLDSFYPYGLESGIQGQTNTLSVRVDANIYDSEVIDIFQGNNTKTINYTYAQPPQITLLDLPYNRYTTTDTISLFTHVSVTSIDNRVKKVEFYANNVLIHSDSVAPYNFVWRGATSGIYQLYAKAYDIFGGTRNSNTLNLEIADILDAKIVGIVAPIHFVGRDTIKPIVTIQNGGTLPIQSFTMYYQLDNNIIQSKLFNSLNIQQRNNFECELPTIRYNEGNHIFKTWISQVTSNTTQTDVNSLNDTFQVSFRYQNLDTCGAVFEPNNTIASAIRIPLGTPIRASLNLPDEDYYIFSTLPNREAFTITVDSMAGTIVFDLYKVVNGRVDNTSLYSRFSRRDPIVYRPEDNLSIRDTLTYIIKITTASWDTGSRSTCYRLHVNAYPLAFANVVIDSIYPQGDIENINNIRLKIRNLGNRPIQSLSVSWNITGYYNENNTITLPYPVMPNDTTNITINTLRILPVGQYNINARVSSVNSNYLDNNNLLIATQPIRIIAPPSITMTSPIDGSVFVPNSNITLAANAVPHPNFTITKVEFYNGDNLLNTDIEAPYTFNWTNVPVGAYQIKAKAYDTQNTTKFSTPITFSISGNNDAGVSQIVNPNNLIIEDSIKPTVIVRNYGFGILRNINLNYQIDDNAIITQNFSGLNINSGRYDTFRLPLSRGYTEGVHRLKVWTSLPNAIIDTVSNNDTLITNFEYRGWDYCMERFEQLPSNVNVNIPINTKIRSKLSYSGDVDNFFFVSPANKERIKIVYHPDNPNVTIRIFQYLNMFSGYVQIGVLRRPDTFVIGENQIRQGIINGAYPLSYRIEVSGITSQNCYAFSIIEYPKPIHDLTVEEVIEPRLDVFNDSLNIRLRVRNTGEVVSSNSFDVFLDTTFVGNFGAYNPIAVNDTATITLSNLVVPFKKGAYNTLKLVNKNPEHLYRYVYPNYYPYSYYRDTNRLNDTTTLRLRRVVPPSVTWRYTQQDTIMRANDPLILPIQAIPTVNNTIQRVAFYQNETTLLGIDSVAPFSWSIPNLPAGIYKFKARAFDNENFTDTSKTFIVYATQGFDIATHRIIAPRGLIYVDSIAPNIDIKNYSNSLITSITVNYQLDNGNINAQTFNNLALGVGNLQNLALPIIRYMEGQHRLKVWVSNPNGSNDSYSLNDTLVTNFEYVNYSSCTNVLEPNNSINEPIYIPTNTVIRSQLTTTDYVDFYVFRTTADKPQFMVKLYELPEDYDLTLYKVENNNANYIAASNRFGLSEDSISYTSSLDTGTYIVKVTSWSSTSNLCYALHVRTFGNQIYDLAIDSIIAPSAVMGNGFVATARIKNNSNVAVHSLNFNGYTVNLSRPLAPNDTITLSYGWQPILALNYVMPLRFSVRQPNGFTDINPRNDTATVYYRFIVPPSVTFSTQNNRRVFISGTDVNLTALVEAHPLDTIRHVAFYRNDTLLGTQQTAPYTFTWSNATLGTHHFKAKVFDSQNLTVTSDSITTTVIDANVIGVRITQLIRPTTQVNEDSLRPAIKLLNVSSRALTNITLNYQLNNGNVVSQTFSNLNWEIGTEKTFSLSMMRHGGGTHQFRIWTSNINGANTGSNDSLRLSFNTVGMAFCNNSFEPNDSFDIATPIAVNTIVTSRITVPNTDFSERDIYTFSTNSSFKVKLWSSGASNIHYFNLYRQNNDGSYEYINGASINDSITYIGTNAINKFFLEVTGYRSDSCYSFKITPAENVFNDIAIDSIITPDSVVYGSFTPSVRVKNRGTQPINQFMLFYQWSYSRTEDGWQYYNTPLQPNESRIITLRSSVEPYSGSHSVLYKVSIPNSNDINNGNDTLRKHFTNITQPYINVSLNNIDDSLQGRGGSITFNTTAWADRVDSILSVEYYNGNTLLARLNTQTYNYTWSNLPIGVHNIKVKASTRYNLFAYDSLTIRVIDTSDIGISSIKAPSAIVGIDSIYPIVELKNFGFNPIQHCRIHYQIDNQAIISYNFPVNSFYLRRFGSANSTEVRRIPIPIRYTEGVHTLKVWTSFPNGLEDNNNQNDTAYLTFRHINPTVCGNHFEPNNTLADAQYVPTDTTVYAMMSAEGFDYYRFSIPAEQMAITINVNNLPNAYIGIIETGDYSQNGLLSFYSSGFTTDYTLVVRRFDSSNSCYSMRIKQIKLADIAVRQIIAPQSNIYSSSFQPRVVIRNQGSVAIDSVLVSYTNQYGYYRFTPALQPNEDRTITFNNEVRGYNLNTFTNFRIDLSMPNGYLDANINNNSLSSYFTYLSPISVTTIVPQTNYVQGATVNISASLSASSGVVSRVEFYNGDSLLSTDNTAPYAYSWANVQNGTYTLRSKAYAEGNTTFTSAPVTIYVGQANIVTDGGISQIINPTTNVTVDTTLFSVRLRNFSQNRALQNATIKYQLNTQNIDSLVWSGNLAADSSTIVYLRTLQLTQIGNNNLKVWSEVANDNNRANDTLFYTFMYQLCGNNYEPNDTIAQAFRLQVNKRYYAMINQTSDKDFYRFTTTAQRPKLMITLNHNQLDCDLTLYEVANNGTLTLLTAQQNRLIGRERIVWNNTTTNNDYMLVVKNNLVSSSIDSCYDLIVEVADTNFVTNGQEIFKDVIFKMYPNPAQDQVTIEVNTIQTTDFEIQITDILGRNVWVNKLSSSNLNTPLSISTQNWAKGLYLVTIKQKGKFMSKKLIID